MDQNISFKNFNDKKDEERQPLNAMVAMNLKEIILRRIYGDVEESVKSSKIKLSPVVRQYLASLGPIMSNVSCGMAAGYSAILLPQLMSVDTEIFITKEQGTWIASVLVLPLIFGCLFSGSLLNLLGPKKGLIIFCMPFTLGWIVLGYASSVTVLYIGRLITGFCVGLVTPLVQVYVAEISQPDQRGILLSGTPLAIAIGILVCHILGTFLTWRLTAWLCGIPPLICILSLFFFNESPTWLFQKGRLKEAEKAFYWFRGYSEESIKEFKGLTNPEEEEEEKNQNSAMSKLKMCLKPSFMKPFMIMNFFFMIQQFSGVNAVAFYSVSILKNVLTSVNEYYSTLLIDIVRFIASVVAIILLKRFGRKQLAVTSAIGTSISLFLLTLYLGCLNPKSAEELNSLNVDSGLNVSVNETSASDSEVSDSTYYDVVSYLPLVFLMSYICFVSLGLVPLPWVLAGEIFSKKMRGIGNGTTMSFTFVCYFIVVKFTPTLFETIHDYGTFCFFAVITILGSIVLQLFLPETKDKTLEEIEDFFRKKKRLEDPGTA